MSATSSAILGWSAPYSVSFNTRRTASAQPSSYLERALAARSSAAKDPLIYEIHGRLDRIEKLPRNWDGNDSFAPDTLAIANARQFVEDLFQQTVDSVGGQVASGTPTHWQSPHVTTNEDGEVVLEWWNGDRKLTVYIGRGRFTYIRSWGPDIVNEMEDGPILGNGVLPLWNWLFG